MEPHPGHVRADRLFTALGSLALLTTVLGVGRHSMDALGSAYPDQSWSSIPLSAVLVAFLHVILAVASLVLGYLLIAICYPARHLLRLATANPAAAIQICTYLLGAALVAIVSWGGCDAASLGVSAAFWLLGTSALIILDAGHRLVTRYRDHEEILAGNVAAALAAAGLHLAVAVVVSHAIEGQFLGWAVSLRAFAAALIWVLALYPLRQLVLARMILRMSPREMDQAISVGHDHYLGAAEGASYVLTSLCLCSGW